MSRKVEKVISVYVDTNVLINYCTGQKKDIEALNYIMRKRRKEVLFTSSLAVAQAISNLQTKKKTRKAFSSSQVRDKLNALLVKFTVLDLTYKDILDAMAEPCKDIEDSIHFIASQKTNCDAIITNNTKDFECFSYYVTILEPIKHTLALKIE